MVDIAFKVLLIGLVVVIAMALADIAFAITNRAAKRNEWYAVIGSILLILDVVGWFFLLLTHIWLYA